MSKMAFVYPGQGVQNPGMGADFYKESKEAEQIYNEAESILDFDIKKVCFEENDLINNTEYTQAALVTTYLAITGEVIKRKIFPDVTAGLSLGEYGAICVAGGMNEKEAISLVRKRGIYMNNAVPEGFGGMTAVLGLNKEDIDNVLREKDGVSVANYNCPGQIVITGSVEAIESSVPDLKKLGARCVKLKVRGPFHSPYLKEAGEKLGRDLEKVTFNKLSIPYVSNVTGEYVDDIKYTKELLKQQVYSPVKWEQSVRCMIENGVDTFVEIGPGRTIGGFIRKIDKTVRHINISTVEDLKKLDDLR